METFRAFSCVFKMNDAQRQKKMTPWLIIMRIAAASDETLVAYEYQKSDTGQ
jgi:hypothetical protein